MIILESAPKLPTDPTAVPTNREHPQSDIEAHGESSRSPSPNPTLPDYETSEAQQQPSPRPKLSRGQKIWFSRVGRLISYAMLIYSLIIVLVGVPMFVLRSKSHHKFKWRTDDDEFGPGHPSQHSVSSQMDMSAGKDAGTTPASCNVWAELDSPPGKSPTGVAMSRLTFPLDPIMALVVDADAHDLAGYVTGSLTVNMNSEPNTANPVLLAYAQYSNLQLFNASSICVSQASNTTQITIHIPKRTGNSSDTIQMDLTLLLPQSQTTIKFDRFSTQVASFKQVFGNLPRVFFERLRIEGFHSPITVGSISAAAVRAQTSNANISGNFCASERIHLDTVNGAVSANVSLRNNKKQKRHTRLTVETGNGPILVQVNIAVEERVYFSTPKHRNFFTQFRNFNAPINVSLTHADGSKPARIELVADNSQGPIDVYLDPLYTGIFDVHTKSATAKVLPSFVSVPPSVINGVGEGKRRDLHFTGHVSKERTRGWIGDDRRPEEFDRNKIGRVELTNSLAPVQLHVALLKNNASTSTSIRR